MNGNSILGNAILGTADSPVHAPDTFRDDLLHKYLDAASRTAVAQTCKAGLTWVLQEWPEATLRFAVRAASEQPPDQLPQRLQVIADQLSLRGDKPTTLALVQRGWQVARDDPGVHATVSALQWPNPPAALTLALQLQYIPRELLSHASTAFAGLTSLVLGPACGSGCNEAVLPAPSALPALRHLTVQRVARSAQAGLWASVGPYMRQLQSLVILEQPGETYQDDEDAEIDRPFWASLFSPSTATQTLQGVRLPWPLEPWLAAILQKYARSLQELTVQGASGSEDGTDVRPQCSWTTLRCTDTINEEVWSWFPVPMGKLVVEMLGKDEQQRCIAFPLDTMHEVSHKLASLTLKGCDTLILAAEGVSHDEQPQALRDALPHLQPLHTPGIELQLDFFLLNRAVTAELCGLEAAGWGKLSLAGADWGMRHPAPPASAPLPPLNYLNLTDYTLDNSLLQDLVQWCPVVRWLVVENVALSGPLPEGCVVPWEVVGVEECMSVSDWLQQSEWVGGIVQWELGALRICLQPEEVLTGEHHRLAQHLKTARITKLEKVIVCAADETPSDASLLRASFTVLQALPCKPKELGFHGWQVTPAVVSEFGALSSVPVLQQATSHPTILTLLLVSGKAKRTSPDVWPLARLPLFVPPRAFDIWRVDVSGLRTKELEALILSTSADCSEQEHAVWGTQHALSISVAGQDEEWAESLRARLAALGTYEHVTLTVDEWWHG